MYFLVPKEQKADSVCSTCAKWFRLRFKNAFKKKLFYKRIPVLDWLPRYKKDYIINDLVAGLTVGLTVIPQAIAYASVAGLPLQVCIYNYFIFTNFQN